MTKGQLGTVLRHIRDLSDSMSAEDLTDADLMQRLIHHRDDVAFRVLVQRHGGLVLHVCRNVLHQETDAEDAFQATFLILARQAVSIQKQASISCWLHGVAFRTAMNLRKSAMRRTKHERAAVDRRSPESPVSAAALKELQFLLDEELQSLSECYRAPFVLCCLEGKSRAEAAQELGWKEGTLSSRLAKARKMLQHRLTARGVSLSAALCAVAVIQNASSAAPALLTTGTIKAALDFAAAKATGAVSASVIALAKGVLQGMVITKIKTGAAMVLLVLLGVFAAGALVAFQESAEKRTKEAESNKPGGVKTQQAKSAPGPIDEGAPRAPTEKPDSGSIEANKTPQALPQGAVLKFGMASLHHGMAGSAAFSPDGTTLVTRNNTDIRLWDLKTRTLIRTLDRPQDKQFSAAKAPVLGFSPDGKQLYELDDDLLTFDVASGKELTRFTPPEKFGAVPCACSPDHKIFAGSFQKGAIAAPSCDNAATAPGFGSMLVFLVLVMVMVMMVMLTSGFGFADAGGELVHELDELVRRRVMFAGHVAGLDRELTLTSSQRARIRCMAPPLTPSRDEVS